MSRFFKIAIILTFLLSAFFESAASDASASKRKSKQNDYITVSKEVLNVSLLQTDSLQITFPPDFNEVCDTLYVSLYESALNGIFENPKYTLLQSYSDSIAGPLTLYFSGIVSTTDTQEQITVVAESNGKRCLSAPITVNYTIDSIIKKGTPIIVINTPEEVIDKEHYVENSSFLLYDAEWNIAVDESMKIKFRGNSTATAPKKPFALKFYDKVSLFDFAESKNYVMLSNYMDPTLNHTDLVVYMENSCGVLDYTPSFVTVYLIYNGKYQGLYQIGEKLEITKGKVLDGEDGWLVEVDLWSKSKIDNDEEIVFYVPHLSYPIVVKDFKMNGSDEIKRDDANSNYIRDFIYTADSILFSENWLDSINGYKKYFDIDTFIDFYLIQEIGRNLDGALKTSCFMTLTPDEGAKLKMGPLWDFDRFFGGNNTSPRRNNMGLQVLKSTPWFNRMYEDPEFVERLKKQFELYESHLPDYLNFIDSTTSAIHDAAYYDYQIWHPRSPHAVPTDKEDPTYDSIIEYYRNYIEDVFPILRENYYKIDSDEDGNTLFSPKTTESTDKEDKNPTTKYRSAYNWEEIKQRTKRDVRR